MRPNKIRELWQDGKSAVNGWLTIPSALVAETVAHEAFDSVTVDMQHGNIDYQAAWHMLTAISTTDTVPFVRVPWREPGIVMAMLDAGAYGIICPMINTAEEAEDFVSMCRYAPAGRRSYGPIRAALYGGSDYQQKANDTVVTMAMIETREAVDNVADIVAVPGLDAVYIGPSDLSVALGHAPQFDHEPGPVFDAIEAILEAAQAQGIPAGIHNGSAEYALRMVNRGFQFVSISTDVRLLTERIQNSLKVVHNN